MTFTEWNKLSGEKKRDELKNMSQKEYKKFLDSITLPQAKIAVDKAYKAIHSK